MNEFEEFMRRQKEGTPSPVSPMAAPASVTPPSFESFMRQMNEQTLQGAQTTTVVNSQQSAATAASAAPLAKQLGVPQAAIETDLPKFQQQAKAEKNSKILSDNPIVARWVAANPDSARIAQDEYESLGAVEKLWEGSKGVGYSLLQGLGGSYNSAALGLNRAIQPWARLMGNDDWWDKTMVQPRAEAAKAFELGADAGFGQKATQMVGNLLGLLSQITLTGGGQGQAVPAAAGAAETLKLGTQTAAKAMAFPSLTEAENRAHEVYEKTGDVNAAYKAAASTYLFTTLQGLVPFSATGTVAQRLGTGAVAGVSTSEAQRGLNNLLMPAELQQKFDPQEALFQAITGAALGGVFGPRTERNLHAAVRHTYTEALRAEQATVGVEQVQQLSQIAQKSKLREADPDAFKDFVEQVTDRTDLDAVYIDPKTLGNALAQSEVALPEIRRQLAESAVTGSDVRIPIADYAAHIAGTPMESAILNKLKVSADGMTFEEGQQHYKEAADQLKVIAEKAAQAETELTQIKTEAQQVFDNVYGQLEKVKRFTSDVNRAYAAMTRDFFTTLSERTGESPKALFERYALKIAAESPAQMGTLLQTVYHGSPHKFDKFDSSKIGTGEGAQAYGHGLYLADNPATAKTYATDRSYVGRTMAGTPDSTQFDAAWIAKQAVDVHGDGAVKHLEMVLRQNASKNPAQIAANKEVADALTLVRSGQVKPSGNLYKVDLPDEAIAKMLDWDKPLSQQAPEVQNAFASYTEQMPWLRSAPGKDAYTRAAIKGGESGAANELRKAGIPGIRYLDGGSRGAGKGTYNYVIFPGEEGLLTILGRNGKPLTDAMKAELLQKPLEQGDRGSFTPDTNVLALFKGADLSTFLHESGHFFLEVYTDVARRGGAPGLEGDVQKVLDWFKVKDLASWQAMDLETRRPFHEKFARGFETYLMEGKSPTPELRPMFARFRSWLLAIYKSVRQLGADITPEVRGVFDRMLASQEAIQEAELQRRYQPLFDSAKEAKLSDEEFAAYQALGQQATDEAITTLQARSMRDMKWASGAKSKALKEIQSKADSERKAITEQVTAEMDARPEFQALELIKAKDPEALLEAGNWADQREIVQRQAKQMVEQAKVKAESMKTEWDLANPEPKEKPISAADVKKRVSVLESLMECLK
jgi:hypothetical protein